MQHGRYVLSKRNLSCECLARAMRQMSNPQLGANASAIRQAISHESLFQVLYNWCREGAGRKNWTLRILSAFVSGNGVQALAPLFDVFLADGNHLDIIFGV